MADFDRVPRLVRDLVLAGAYNSVSAEVYHRPPEGCEGTGKVLRRVAFLGGELPHLKSLPEVAALYADDSAYCDFFSEHADLRRLVATTIEPEDSYRVDASVECYACFAEAKTMAVTRKSVEDLLKKMNVFTPAMADPKVYPDEALFDQIGFHVENIATEGNPDPYADLGRDEVVAKILELDPSQDAERLAVTPDGDLHALLADLEDETVDKNSDKTAVDANAVVEKVMAKFSEVADGFKRDLDQKMAKFGETTAKSISDAVEAGVKRVEDAAKAGEKTALERKAADDRAQCFAEIEALVNDGYLEPAEVADDPKRPGIPGVRTTALSMDNTAVVHKHSDAQGIEHGMTARQLYLAGFRARPRDAARLPQPDVDEFSETEEEETAEAMRKYCKGRNGARQTAETRVN